MLFSPDDLDQFSEVLPYLFIGSYGAAENWQRLEEQKITHVVCLLEEYPESVAPLPTLRVPMSDYGDSDIQRLLLEVVPFIEGARDSGGRVLIFCALGVNRSPALVAGYLQAALGFSTVEAVRKISSSRPFVSIHEKYLSQLERLGGHRPVVS